jgi:hypothetical protein
MMNLESRGAVSSDRDDPRVLEDSSTEVRRLFRLVIEPETRLDTAGDRHDFFRG